MVKRRLALLLLGCIVALTGCDGLLGINEHVLADAGEGGPGDGGVGRDADADSGVPAVPDADASR